MQDAVRFDPLEYRDDDTNLPKVQNNQTLNVDTAYTYETPHKT